MMSSLIEPPPNWVATRHHPIPGAGCGCPHLPLKPSFLAHHGPHLPVHLFGRRLFPFPFAFPTRPDAAGVGGGSLKGRLRANSSCEQDRDSGEKREGKGGGEPKPPRANPPPPNRGKGRWGKKGGLQWRPLVQAQEVGVLLLQLGLVMTAMRFLRPAIPLPGADPRPRTTYASVPYSDFLSRINSNQVQKVEVDGVHIMFRLRSETAAAAAAAAAGGKGEDEAGRLQEAESLMRSVTPTKRIVYTTTRPTDIKAPYEKMLENEVEFGSPDKRSGGFLNSGLVRFYSSVYGGINDLS